MGPFIRIGLRYLGGYLAARGFLASTDTGLFDDPDLVAALSYSGAALCALAGEGNIGPLKSLGGKSDSHPLMARQSHHRPDPR